MPNEVIDIGGKNVETKANQIEMMKRKRDE